MPNSDLVQISHKLDRVIEGQRTLIRLVALSAVQGKVQRDQLPLLSAAGFAPREIASLLETTPNTIRVELSKLRQRNRRKKRSKGGK